MGLWADRTCQRKAYEGNCETSLVKLRKGRLKTAESPGRGGPQDERDASLIPLHSGISSEGNVVHSKEAYGTIVTCIASNQKKGARGNATGARSPWASSEVRSSSTRNTAQPM
jgi:hypothetical protein